MNIEVDLHTHTFISGHAFATAYEMAAAASRHGLKGIALTDHSGPTPSSLVTRLYLEEFSTLERSHEGVSIFRGIEANITESGELDIQPDLVRLLDFVAFGYHDVVPIRLDKDLNTERILKSFCFPGAKVFHHPLRQGHDFHLDTIVAAAKERGIAIEINDNALRSEPDAEWLELARCCAAHGCPVSVGSDAHTVSRVGQFRESLALIEASGVQRAQIVNRTVETTCDFLGVML